jgi:hypothetical protein
MPSGIPRGTKPEVSEFKVRRMLGVKGKTQSSSEEAKPVGKKRKPRPRHFGVLDNNEIETPNNLMHELESEFGMMFDPCPFVGHGKRPDFDGLTIPWKEVNYVNPPYNEIEPWFNKAITEMLQHRRTSVFLVPARPGTRYWQRTVYRYATELRWITGKIIFKTYTTPPAHNLAIIVFAQNNTSQFPSGLSEFYSPLMFNPKIKTDGQEFGKVFLTIVQSTNPITDASYVQHPYFKPLSSEAQYWNTILLSATELMNGYDERTLEAEVQKFCLPFFYWLLLFEQTIATFPKEDATFDFDRRFALPELLRLIRPKMLQEPYFLRHAVDHSVFALSEDWFTSVPKVIETVRSFYEAYCHNTKVHNLRQQRVTFLKESHDGDFIQVTTFL